MNTLSKNQALWRSIHSLTHPISILAVLLLLFNDHYLRHVSPSWVTGKLGDFTWLLFAPFIAGLLFALIIPRRIQNHERVVGFASIGFIGVWFATAKTIPFVHHITTSAFEWLVRWQGQLRLDVTDLLTLPVLLISWYIWRTVPNTEINLKPYAPIIIVLAILGTLASDVSAPDNGIFCLSEQDNVLYAGVNGQYDFARHFYESPDGGFTWQETETPITCSPKYRRTAPIPIENKARMLLYIFHLDDRIDVMDLEAGRIVESYYLSQYRFDIRDRYYARSPEFVDYLFSPLDAVIHPETGNLILAMSLDGVLIITPEGEQIWADVGDYQYTELTDAELFKLIDFAFLIALPLFFMVASTLLLSTTQFIYRGDEQVALIVIFLWIIWLAVVSISDPSRGLLWGLSLHGDFGQVINVLIGLFFTVPPFYILVGRARIRNSSAIMPTLLYSVAIILVFILPYIFWLEGRIPVFLSARFFAIAGTVFTMLFAYFYLKNRYHRDWGDMVAVREPQISEEDFDINPTVDPFE